MRLPLLLALLATSAAAQPASRVVPFGGFGFGAAWDPEDGWLEATLNAGARAGVPTAMLRVTGLGQVLGRDERWDVSALGGATLDGPVGVVFVGAGPSLAGGIDRGFCFLAPTSCATAPGRRLPLRLGLGLAAEAGLRLTRHTVLTAQASANLAGARTIRGAALGVRREF